MHLFEAFRRLGYREGDFPNAETIGARTVTLPLFTQMRTRMSIGCAKRCRIR